MAFCAKCGKKLAWWSARHSVKGLPYCLDCGAQAEKEASAKAAERVRARQEEQEALAKAEEERRAKEKEEAEREARERWKVVQEAYEKARQQEREAREKAEQEAREKAEQEEKARKEHREWRNRELSDLELAVAQDPDDSEAHLRLARFLNPGFGFDALEEEIWLKGQTEEECEEYQELKMKACESYLKAIALGIPNRNDSAEAKLEYSSLLNHDNRMKKHYAREAEKDLRVYLRSHPADSVTLSYLKLAIEGYEENEQRLEERLTAIDARMAEAKMRGQMHAAPASDLGGLGDIESPYPENWKELSESVKHRDGHKCSDCGASGVELHVHHVIPLSKGGTNDLDNLTTLCRQCHGMIHPRMGDRP